MRTRRVECKRSATYQIKVKTRHRQKRIRELRRSSWKSEEEGGQQPADASINLIVGATRQILPLPNFRLHSN
jgi:hypothetical protein